MWMLLFLVFWPASVWGQAPVAAHLTSGIDGTCTAASAPAVASISPAANALILASVTVRHSTNPAAVVTMTGNGLTWTVIDTQASGSGRESVTLFRAMSGSPSPGNPTIGLSADMGQCSWTFAQYTGTDTSGTNGSGAIVQTKKNAGSVTAGTGLLTVTLDNTFGDVNNVAFGAFGNAANSNLTVGAGFTEIGAQGTGQAGRNFMETDGVDNSVDAGTATTTTVVMGIAVEIKTATPGGPPAGGKRRRAPQHHAVLEYFLSHFFVPAYPGGVYVAG